MAPFLRPLWLVLVRRPGVLEPLDRPRDLTTGLGENPSSESTTIELDSSSESEILERGYMLQLA